MLYSKCVHESTITCMFPCITPVSAHFWPHWKRVHCWIVPTPWTRPQPPEIPVEEEEWFFGDIDRRLSESKCKNPGDYLVRYSARQNKYVLTCNFNGHGKHFVIQQIPDVSKLLYQYLLLLLCYPLIKDHWDRDCLQYQGCVTPQLKTTGALSKVLLPPN